MAKNDQEEAYDRVLVASLSRTLDLMKFAETKNAALLTFCSAWMFGSVNILISSKSLPAHFLVALKWALPLFVLAGLICIASFLPRLNPGRFYRKKQPKGLNLLFFGDIAMFPVSKASMELERYRPGPGRSASDAYLEDMAAQIAINSQIASRKYLMFNLSAYLVVAAFFILGCPEMGWIWDRFLTWLVH